MIDDVMSVWSANRTNEAHAYIKTDDGRSPAELGKTRSRVVLAKAEADPLLHLAHFWRSVLTQRKSL